MVVDSMLTHAKSGPNDHRKDAPPFTFIQQLWIRTADVTDWVKWLIWHSMSRDSVYNEFKNVYFIWIEPSSIAWSTTLEFIHDNKLTCLIRDILAFGLIPPKMGITNHHLNIHWYWFPILLHLSLSPLDLIHLNSMSDPRTLPLMTDPHSTLLFRWSFVLAIFQIIIMVLIIMTLMASNESISLTLLYEEPENRELDRRSINVLTLNCSYSCHHFNFSWVYDVIMTSSEHFLGKS